jgi:hypothetical protein
MKVIGAGFGRTGTYSLKLALERLLDKPCYHMAEVFEKLESDVPVWHAASKGDMPDWKQFLDGYGAAVDLPASLFWKELSDAYPDALIILSVRDTDSWWESARATIYEGLDQTPPPPLAAWKNMVVELHKERFTDNIADEDACKSAFEQHNEKVRKNANPDRLLVWHPSEGWEPICKALGVEVPDEPFPKANTKEEFIGRRLDKLKEDATAA